MVAPVVGAPMEVRVIHGGSEGGRSGNTAAAEHIRQWQWHQWLICNDCLGREG